jgi:hypothetical protein
LAYLISTKAELAPQVEQKAFNLCALLETPVGLNTIQELGVGVTKKPSACLMSQRGAL